MKEEAGNRICRRKQEEAGGKICRRKHEEAGGRCVGGSRKKQMDEGGSRSQLEMR